MVDKTFCDICGNEVTKEDRKTVTIGHYHEEKPVNDAKPTTKTKKGFTEYKEEAVEVKEDNKDRTYTLCLKCLEITLDEVS